MSYENPLNWSYHSANGNERVKEAFKSTLKAIFGSKEVLRNEKRNVKRKIFVSCSVLSRKIWGKKKSNITEIN